MSATAEIRENPPEHSEGLPQPPRPGAFADPVVRVMAYAALAIVIVFLATVVSLVATGVTAPKGPRSAAERELMATSALVEAGAKGEARAPYINALIVSGDLSTARVALAQARASVGSTTAPLPALDLAAARILALEGQHANAVNMADRAMKGYQAKRDALIAKGEDAAKAAQSGYDVNYYNSALVRGHALAQIGRWKDAIAMYDIYIQRVPSASDIFVDRGNAKAAVNDKAGAEKDYREALRFVPYDEEAKAGLKKIGVAK